MTAEPFNIGWSICDGSNLEHAWWDARARTVRRCVESGYTADAVSDVRLVWRGPGKDVPEEFGLPDLRDTVAVFDMRIEVPEGTPLTTEISHDQFKEITGDAAAWARRTVRTHREMFQ